jgi:hypothetical protein
VDATEKASELKTASKGFRNVTEHFEENYMDGEIKASSIIQRIIRIFARKK